MRSGRFVGALRRILIWVAVVPALACGIFSRSAQAESRLTTDLTLNEMIQRVLERNEGLQGRILELAIARKKHQAEKGIFEPDLVTSYDHVENKPQIGLQEKRLGTVGSLFDENNNIY